VQANPGGERERERERERGGERDPAAGGRQQTEVCGGSIIV
jgi:hypothetical protein